MLCKALAAVILVPGDLVITERCWEHIHVPVTVHIHSMNRQGIISWCGNGMLRKALAAVILVPGDLVIILRSREHIHISVSVHIHCIDRKGSISRCGNCMYKKEISTPIILIPGNGIIIWRSREHIHVPVTIHICRINRCGSIRRGGNIVGGEDYFFRFNCKNSIIRIRQASFSLIRGCKNNSFASKPTLSVGDCSYIFTINVNADPACVPGWRQRRHF